MELQALKSQIHSNTFDDYYIFTGPEVEVMRLYIEQIAKVCNASIKNLDSITDLAQKIHSRSMLKNRSIFIIRDSKEFMQDESIQSKMTQNNAFGDDIIIFIYSVIDKRSRLYKQYQDRIVTFEPLNANVLIKYIQREVNLSERSCRKLIEVCESDYSRILLELDKIKQFGKDTFSEVHGDGFDADKTLDYLLADGTIYQPPRDAVFDFVDAVLCNKPKLAFRLLDEAYCYGEATMVLLANLYNSTKQLLQVQSYRGNSKITDVTGLTPYQVKLANDHRGHFSDEDLVYLMKLTRTVERNIKLGEIDEAIAVCYILVNFF